MQIFQTTKKKKEQRGGDLGVPWLTTLSELIKSQMAVLEGVNHYSHAYFNYIKDGSPPAIAVSGCLHRTGNDGDESHQAQHQRGNDVLYMLTTVLQMFHFIPHTWQVTALDALQICIHPEKLPKFVVNHQRYRSDQASGKEHFSLCAIQGCTLNLGSSLLHVGEVHVPENRDSTAELAAPGTGSSPLPPEFCNPRCMGMVSQTWLGWLLPGAKMQNQTSAH